MPSTQFVKQDCQHSFNVTAEIFSDKILLCEMILSCRTQMKDCHGPHLELKEIRKAGTSALILSSKTLRTAVMSQLRSSVITSCCVTWCLVVNHKSRTASPHLELKESETLGLQRWLCQARHCQWTKESKLQWILFYTKLKLHVTKLVCIRVYRFTKLATDSCGCVTAFFLPLRHGPTLVSHDVVWAWP